MRTTASSRWLGPVFRCTVCQKLGRGSDTELEVSFKPVQHGPEYIPFRTPTPRPLKKKTANLEKKLLDGSQPLVQRSLDSSDLTSKDW